MFNQQFNIRETSSTDFSDTKSKPGRFVLTIVVLIVLMLVAAKALWQAMMVLPFILALAIPGLAAFLGFVVLKRLTAFFI
mgnify:CR=1 FL=1